MHEPAHNQGPTPAKSTGAWASRFPGSWADFFPHAHGRTGGHRLAGGHLAGGWRGHRGLLKRQSYVYPRRSSCRFGECRSTTRSSWNWASDWGRGSTGVILSRATSTTYSSHRTELAEFRSWTIYKSETEYRKHLRKGFSTPTKKVELYSTIMEGGAMTHCRSTRRCGEPGQPARYGGEYPYILITGARSSGLLSLGDRMVPCFARSTPTPSLKITPGGPHNTGIRTATGPDRVSEGRHQTEAKLTRNRPQGGCRPARLGGFPEVKTPDMAGTGRISNILTDNDPANVTGDGRHQFEGPDVQD